MNYWTDEIAQLREELREEKDKTDQLQREVTRLKEECMKLLQSIKETRP